MILIFYLNSKVLDYLSTNLRILNPFDLTIQLFNQTELYGIKFKINEAKFDFCQDGFYYSRINKNGVRKSYSAENLDFDEVLSIIDIIRFDYDPLSVKEAIELINGVRE